MGNEEIGSLQAAIERWLDLLQHSPTSQAGRHDSAQAQERAVTVRGGASQADQDGATSEPL
jgi:hypothetical protein